MTIDVVKTVKIKSSHPSQGAFVEINESDFDAKIHTLFEPRHRNPLQYPRPLRLTMNRARIVKQSNWPPMPVSTFRPLSALVKTAKLPLKMLKRQLKE